MVVAFFSNCRFFYYNDDVVRIVMLMFFKIFSSFKNGTKNAFKIFVVGSVSTSNKKLIVIVWEY